MVVDEAMIVAGIGCRKGADTRDVMAGIERALDHHGIAALALDALATVPLKENEPALHAAARQLGLALLIATGQSLKETEGRTLSHSEASFAHVGTPSASEAAALAAAGPRSRLLGPRIVTGSVTCAIAVGGVTTGGTAP